MRFSHSYSLFSDLTVKEYFLIFSFPCAFDLTKFCSYKISPAMYIFTGYSKKITDILCFHTVPPSPGKEFLHLPNRIDDCCGPGIFCCSCYNLHCKWNSTDKRKDQGQAFPSQDSDVFCRNQGRSHESGDDGVKWYQVSSLEREI